MSANKLLKWSENEKVSLLVQAIQALSGSSFPYDSVKLPGRTKRSIMHAWTSARAQHANFIAQAPSDEDPAVTPSRGRGKKSRKRKLEDFASDDDEDVKPRSKKASILSASSKSSIETSDDKKIGKIKNEPQSPVDESKDGLLNDEA